MDIAKKANNITTQAVALMQNEADINEFGKVGEIFNNAAGMVNGDENKIALLKNWAVAMANRAVYVLFRRDLLTSELEAEFRKLPSIEEAQEDFAAYEAEEKKKADELEAKRVEYMNGQHDMDIFKAVLSGTSKEKAEEAYKKYLEQIAQSTGK